MAGITILWGYGVLEVNSFVMLDLAILFVVILLLKQIVKWLMPTKEAGLGDLGGGLGGGLGGDLGKDLGGGGSALPPMGKEDDFKMPPMPKF